eukprot:TRINITY_DN3843_c0_g1_i1.p1 TRINITY_DN3843_c0_g1~~TRINITY_DN3843_c0_g1_i1.p1  ORF type:complete len:403 (+),score=84.95 TRINITY_DN3843_c0_g1_i1:98-1306(+)
MVHMDFDGLAEPIQADKTCDEEELGRTESQIFKRSKINSVLDHLANCKDPIMNLQRTVSELSAQMGQESSIERTLSEAHKATEQRSAEVDAAVKTARNLGEDLLEDLLQLDKLSGLAPGSRTKRKTAINSLETLLDTVDTSKDRLSRQQKELKTRLEMTTKQLAERQAQQAEKVADAAREAQRAQTSRQPQTARPARTVEGDRAVPGVRPRPQTARAGQRAGAPVALDAATAIADLLPLPPAELWRRQRLPVEFESQTAEASYEVVAQVPELRNEDVSLRLNSNASFTVRGQRLPTQLEAEEMRQQLAEKLVQLGAAAETLSVQQIWEAYAVLGKSRYGYFEETLRLPQDVNISSVRAACLDGFLRVSLPRRIRSRQFPTYNSRHSPRLFSDFGGDGRDRFF